MKVLMVGDIVGKGGRRSVIDSVPRLREELGCQLCIANGENMAGGGGMTVKCVNSLSHAKVDVVTGGDHMWDQKEFVDGISAFSHVLRPANLNVLQPGRGYGIFTASNGVNVGVISLQGRSLMTKVADNPFTAADRIVNEIRKTTPVIFVDMHAEATSEKVAMGRYLDGRVSAVLGTHTHVPTADDQVFEGGTAFQCDVGMVGSRHSVLGRAVDPVVHHFSTGMPAKFSVVENEIRLHATVVEVDAEEGHAYSTERVRRDWD